MDKVIKCILIGTDTIIVSEIAEIYAEIGDPNCKLIKPYRYYGENDLRPWPEVTDETEILVRAENLFTIVDPKESILEKYLELTE